MPSGLRQLPDEFLDCRESHHVWVDPQYTFQDRNRLVVRTRRCERCGAFQQGTANRITGEWVESVRTTLPPGYRLAGVGHNYRHKIRAEIIRRVYNAQARRDQGALPLRPAQEGKNGRAKRKAAG